MQPDTNPLVAKLEATRASLARRLRGVFRSTTSRMPPPAELEQARGVLSQAMAL